MEVVRRDARNSCIRSPPLPFGRRDDELRATAVAWAKALATFLVRSSWRMGPVRTTSSERRLDARAKREDCEPELGAELRFSVAVDVADPDAGLQPHADARADGE